MKSAIPFLRGSLLAMLIAFVFAACTKTQRIIGTWEHSIILEELTQTLSFTFNKDRTFSFRVTQIQASIPYSSYMVGKYNIKKKILTLSYTDDVTETHEIQILTNKELTLKNPNTNFSINYTKK